MFILQNIISRNIISQTPITMHSAYNVAHPEIYKTISEKNLGLGFHKIGNKNVVLFYHQREKNYGCFSNFSSHPVKLQNLVFSDPNVPPVKFEGKNFLTSEHAFQAAKTLLEEQMNWVAQAETPSEVFKRGRKVTLRPDWEQIKDLVMRHILEAKFTQHPTIQMVLLQTGNAILIEHTRNDQYWADHGDGTGFNRLGIELMFLREKVAKKLSETHHKKALSQNLFPSLTSTNHFA